MDSKDSELTNPQNLKPTDNSSDVNGYENLINYQMNPGFNNDISQAVSMGAFEWDNTGNILTNFPTEPFNHRRSSFPDNSLADFPDLAQGRRRVVSWGDLETPMNLNNMDMSMRRASISIPLPTDKSNSFMSEELSSPRSATFTTEDQVSSDNNSKPRESKPSTKAGDCEQQTVVEKRLNRRRERNRLAARRSREKRTQFLHDLERVNHALQSENSQLKTKLCDVLRELEVLRNAASQR
ncbi:hypothetical protein K493DRAFT_319953 [Basidiobolus meristosporus CBS 931.73]|uniref:BZIP domain-containing protein n=1 Tax=Basidiobolus meristosporus CBS 931.73 TaxID=1314790 RepID=A0A1Y1XIB6_9FUNG|nr:hypothetical protein K493DRAFT_319953 [Basidiobolus meristosporus CBS 931.73]|eukprot:ORX85497.1 hypothetical protein K493DRAFT_319953 [Basidiobolus meristosporus CBS 931.73]